MGEGEGGNISFSSGLIFVDGTGSDRGEETLFLRQKSPSRGLKITEKAGVEDEPREERLNSVIMDMGAATGEPKGPIPVLMEREKGMEG